MSRMKAAATGRKTSGSYEDEDDYEEELRVTSYELRVTGGELPKKNIKNA